MVDYGIARTLSKQQTSMLQYLEIDCDGRREELQRLRSLVRGKYEHFAVAVFRSSGKRYMYGITPKAAQELHGILKDPDAAIQRGTSIGKTVHRWMQQKDVISDQMFARISHEVTSPRASPSSPTSSSPLPATSSPPTTSPKPAPVQRLVFEASEDGSGREGRSSGDYFRKY